MIRVVALGLAAGWAMAASLRAEDGVDLRTVAERSGFRATARHGEVTALGEALARRSSSVSLTEFGRSGEGRALPLMVVADPPVRTPEEARASGKLVVLLVGNIHAGEVCGKEALPILVRELTDRPDHPLLRDLILLVAPIFNADGNERVRRDNRPGQVGPEEGMGQRANASGLDLNRDFMKLDAPETRALVRLLDEWDPALTIDTHTTDGSHHRYILTYEGPKNPAGDPRVIAFARDVVFPGLARAFKVKNGRDTFYYGNFEADHSRWATFPSTPRFGTTYVGLRNRLSILTEAYSYAPFEDRVRATLDYCRAACEFAADHRAAIVDLLDGARRRATDAPPGSPVAIRARPRALPEKQPVLGFVERQEGGRGVATAEPKDYLCAIEEDFEPTIIVPRPSSYFIPPDQARAIDLLRAHGIQTTQLDHAEARAVAVDRIDALSRSSRRFEGHNLVDVTATTERSEPRELPAGTVVVATAQPLGPLAVYLLEPRSDDGLATWDLLKDPLAPGQDFPITKAR